MSCYPECLFPMFLRSMKKIFGNRINSDIDYISLMNYSSHIDYQNSVFNNEDPIISEQKKVSNNYINELSKFLKPMKEFCPSFNNYVLDFVFCILYFNNILTLEFFINSMRIFENELWFLDSDENDISIYGFRFCGFYIRIGNEISFKNYDLFDFKI